jgi:hypothetical protein
MLKLAPHALVIPAEGVLHVFTPRGLFDLKGAQVDRLHERLVPHLQGTVEEDQLLRAVPAAQAAAVRAYLAGLREAGALDAGGEDLPAPLDALGPGRTRVRFGPAAHPVEVSIDGALAPEAGATRVCFATDAEARATLLRLGSPGARGGSLACVVGGSGAALEERAVYARWLLRNELDALPRQDRFRLFRLHPATGDLQRLAALGGTGAAQLRTLPEQLGVLRAAEADQVPLVVATAAHPLVGGRATAFGISSKAVHRQLLRVFLGGALLRQGGGARMAGALGDPARAFTPLRGGWPRRAGLAFASCRLELMLELAARWAERRAEARGVGWHPTDLLAAASPHPAAAYLQEVLRTRVAALPAECARTPDGLFVVRAGEHRARSFVQAHALAGVLLQVAWDEFYGDCRVPGGRAAALPACSPLDFAPGAELRRTLRARVAAMRLHGDPARVAVQRMRAWGVPVWVGSLRDEAGDA